MHINVIYTAHLKPKCFTVKINKIKHNIPKFHNILQKQPKSFLRKRNVILFNNQANRLTSTRQSSFLITEENIECTKTYKQEETESGCSKNRAEHLKKFILNPMSSRLRTAIEYTGLSSKCQKQLMFQLTFPVMPLFLITFSPLKMGEYISKYA